MASNTHNGSKSEEEYSELRPESSEAAAAMPSGEKYEDPSPPDPKAVKQSPGSVTTTTSGLQKTEVKAGPPQVRDEHELDEHHGLAHTTPVSLLIGILGALLVLTVITVAVTKVDLGSQGNLVVAMVIATIKAALVVMYFMHLRWDKKMHAVVFLSSVLFVILFLSMAITDRSEYQESIDELEEATVSSQ